MFLYFLILFFIIKQQETAEIITILNVKITFENNGNETKFNLFTSFSNGIQADNAWLGIGFNYDTSMVCIYYIYIYYPQLLCIE